MKKHTVAVCDFPAFSANSKRLFSSIENCLDSSEFEFIYLATGRSHAQQLNMALNACRTEYILFVDSDAEFTDKNRSIFSDLTEFWEGTPDVGSVSFGHVSSPVIVDETRSTPYHNFFITSFKMGLLNKYLMFDEVFEKTQCLDVAWFRAIRHYGLDNYAHPCLDVVHHHTGGHADYVIENQDKLRRMFGCATDANPENSPNGWMVYENYLRTGVLQ